MFLLVLIRTLMRYTEHELYKWWRASARIWLAEFVFARWARIQRPGGALIKARAPSPPWRSAATSKSDELPRSNTNLQVHRIPLHKTHQNNTQSEILKLFLLSSFQQSWTFKRTQTDCRYDSSNGAGYSDCRGLASLTELTNHRDRWQHQLRSMRRKILPREQLPQTQVFLRRRGRETQRR